MATILTLIRSEAFARGWTPGDLQREAGICYNSAWRLLRGGDWRGEQTLSAALVALGLAQDPAVSADSDSR